MSSMQTRSGIKIYPGLLCAQKFSIEDIAWGLSGEGRFSNQSKFHYSVARHSIEMAKIVPDRYRQVALMHDASEAFMRDLATPWKETLPDYAKLEKELLRNIFLFFGLDYSLLRDIKIYDNWMGATEAVQLLSPTPEWAYEHLWVPLIVREYTREMDYIEFMRMFKQLGIMAA